MRSIMIIPTASGWRTRTGRVDRLVTGKDDGGARRTVTVTEHALFLYLPNSGYPACFRVKVLS